MLLHFMPVISVASEEGDNTVFSIIVRDIDVSLTVKGITIKDLIQRLREEIHIEIYGLAISQDRTITFSYTGKTFEIVLRQLLRHLGEKNFAYEFSNDKLVRITVFPKGNETNDLQQILPRKKKPNTVSMVEIVDVLEETQAEALGLKKGDLVYKYNGRRISGHEALVAATFESKGSKSISMVIIRKNKLNRYYLEPGFIGVHVSTKSIPRNELPADVHLW